MEETKVENVETTLDVNDCVQAEKTSVWKNKKWLLPVIIAAAVLLIGVGSFVLYKVFKSKATTSIMKVDYELIPVQDNSDKWGYINHKGEFVINPQFSYCSIFKDGIAEVKTTDGKIGYINKKGEFIIPPIYIDGTMFNDGLAIVVSEGEHPKCINKKNEVVFVLSNAERVGCFSEGLAFFEDENGKCGYVNTKGQIAIPPQFEDAGDFSEGLAAVMNSEKLWGYIDKTGKIVISYQFKSADDFINGIACFSNGSLCGYLDKTGKYIINPQYEFVGRFSEGLAGYSQGKVFGFIDEKGTIVINPQFSNGDEFSEGLAPVFNGNMWGYIDKNGHYVINPQFEKAYSFVDGVAAVLSAGKWGLINKKGKFVVNPMYKSISDPFDLEIFTFTYVSSDYYDANPFITAFTKNFSETKFDGFSKDATLKDIIEHSVYGNQGQVTEKPNSVNLILKHEFGPEIFLYDVEFFFNGALYENNPYDYNYYTGSYGRIYQFDKPIECILYSFKFTDKAFDKSLTIARALKSELSRLYNVTFDVKQNEGIFFIYGSGSEFSFILWGPEDKGTLELNVFPKKATYDEFLQEFNDKFEKGDLSYRQ